MSEVYIFHEWQESLLCGQHCLNNLIQQSVFSPVNLANIANELDEAEANLITDKSQATESGSHELHSYCHT